MRTGLEDPDLNRLRRWQSEKWRTHPPDVLPAFIAEMDYNLAEPVVAALRTAIDRSDCGYASQAWPASPDPRFSAPVAIAAEAGGQVVVDDAAGLHGGVGGHRAGEREAMPPELGAERLAGRRRRWHLG
jgi:hypothetical protein